jgi:GrpB-like predicted nucleotidyltransferase (UPF0157 family)
MVSMPSSGQDEASIRLTDEQIRQVTIGELKPFNSQITLVEYDHQWPAQFDREAKRIQAALGPRALQIEHIGSTSVPSLIAKPVIDILLVVADSSDESSYVPALEAAGYILRIREPNWHQHRLFKGPDTNLGLHVFSKGSEEIDRHVIFRNWLRENAKDRELYAERKRELAGREWRYVQNYADAKSEVISRILSNARAAATKAE